MRSLSSTAKEGAAELSGQGDSAAISLKAETPLTLPALAAAIFPPVRSAEPAKLEVGTSSSIDVQSLRRRLPFIKEFVAASGDWVAFKRRFLTNADLAGWMEVDAQKTLPAALKDDALAAFLAIPPSERSTLKIARCIQGQQNLQRDKVLVACATSSTEPGAHTELEPAPACLLHQWNSVRRGDGSRTTGGGRGLHHPSPAVDGLPATTAACWGTSNRAAEFLDGGPRDVRLPTTTCFLRRCAIDTSHAAACVGLACSGCEGPDDLAYCSS
ncbi:uncharacterized protein LOC144932117 isoform X2 [Lampetra fluviatilis]